MDKNCRLPVVGLVTLKLLPRSVLPHTYIHINLVQDENIVLLTFRGIVLWAGFVFPSIPSLPYRSQLSRSRTT